MRKVVIINSHPVGVKSMSELVEVVGGKPMVSTKSVADKFGKVHRNVMRDVNNIIRDLGDDSGALNFEQSSYTSKQNKILKCYMMGRDEFSLLAMGFTGKEALKWKIAYIKAFNKMEELLTSNQGASVQQSLNEAMRLMQADKDTASGCGMGLNAWKEKRKQHMDKINKLQQDVQLLLNFKGENK